MSRKPKPDVLAVAPVQAIVMAGDLDKIEQAKAGLERYAAEVASRVAEIERELPIYKSIDVTTDAELATADAMLTDLVRWKDGSLEMRGNATAPLYAIVKGVEAWFRPLVKACAEAEGHLKGRIGAFRVKLLDAKKVAEAAAVAAVAKNDTPAVLEALNASTELATAGSVGRSTTRFRWAVKRINERLLPPEWWTPDLAKINAAFAAADGEGDAPVIPGVIPERVAVVGAKR